jgi:DNA-binding transcriptional MerR regulator
MKASEIATTMGRNRQTIINWTTDTRFAKFFSESANPFNGRRFYTASDWAVINTIRVQRDAGKEWDEIALMLENGYRDTDVPPTAATADGIMPIQVYAQAVDSAAQLALALRDLNEAEEEIETLHAEIREMNTAWRKDKAESEAHLNQQIGKLAALLEVEKERRLQLEEDLKRLKGQSGQ